MNIDGVDGRRFPARRIHPDADLAVAVYARVVGAVDPAHRSLGAAARTGHAARPLPAAFLSFFNSLDESDLIETLGITYGSTLFAGIELEFGRTISEADPVDGTTTVVQANRKLGRDGATRQVLVLESEFVHEGDLVLRARTTFLERETR